MRVPGVRGSPLERCAGLRLFAPRYGQTCVRCIVHGYTEVGPCTCYASRGAAEVRAFQRFERCCCWGACLAALGWYDGPPKPGGQLAKRRAYPGSAASPQHAAVEVPHVVVEVPK